MVDGKELLGVEDIGCDLSFSDGLSLRSDDVALGWSIRLRRDPPEGVGDSGAMNPYTVMFRSQSNGGGEELCSV